MFKIITCLNNKQYIGKDNTLLYHLKSDLQNFKRMTLNNVVIMGRKTFESLPHPLLNRINIILTHDKNYKAKDCIICHSIEECIEICKNQFENKKYYVIGGSSIYKEFLDKDLVSTLYITKVDDDTEGDAIFPLVDYTKWHLFYQSLTQQDEKPYTFSIYYKNRNF